MIDTVFAGLAAAVAVLAGRMFMQRIEVEPGYRRRFALALIGVGLAGLVIAAYATDGATNVASSVLYGALMALVAVGGGLLREPSNPPWQEHH